MIETKKEKMDIPFGEMKELFGGDFYVGVYYSDSGTKGLVSVSVGKDGFGTLTEDIFTGQSHTFQLKNPYEIRVFKVSGSYVTIHACELPIIKAAESVFQSSSIFQNIENEEKFDASEIEALRSQLSSLEAKIEELYSLTKTEADYTKSAFRLLNEKLDNSSKVSWRQTAYGVLASVGLSVSIDLDQAVHFFNMAESYLSATTNLIVGKS